MAASMFSSYSTQELQCFLRDLEQAYLSGAKTVLFQGMSTTYASDAELRRRILEVQAAIDEKGGGTSGKKTTKRVYVTTTSRGF